MSLERAVIIFGTAACVCMGGIVVVAYGIVGGVRAAGRMIRGRS
jgi:hypothetical protein